MPGAIRQTFSSGGSKPARHPSRQRRSLTSVSLNSAPEPPRCVALPRFGLCAARRWAELPQRIWVSVTPKRPWCLDGQP